MVSNLIVYEQHPEDFGPLTLTRPVYGLTVGMSTLAEKIVGHEQYRDAKVHFQTRGYLAAILPQILSFQDIFKNRDIGVNNLADVQQGVLFIDGAVIASLSEMPAIDGPNEVGVVKETIEEGRKATERDRVVYIRADAETYHSFGSLDEVLNNPQSARLPVKDVGDKFTVAAFPWDLVMNNGKAIEAEYGEKIWPDSYRLYNTHLLDKKISEGIFFRGDKTPSYISETADICPGVVIDARGNYSVYIGNRVEIQGNVVLDARKGHIYIGDGTTIEFSSGIQGPVYIGPKNLIRQATIREGTSIGPVCKVGGEVEESIIVGHSNKQHYGFLGHAVVGEWVNIGAGATNSDLKNDYSNVEVQLSYGRWTNTHQNKTVGVYVGDHTKIGIGSLGNTGTVYGVGSNVLMNFVTEDKYLPNFCIYSQGRIIPLKASSVLNIAEIVMDRRGVELTEEYRAMMKYLGDQFKEETMQIRDASKLDLPLLEKDVKKIEQRIKEGVLKQLLKDAEQF